MLFSKSAAAVAILASFVAAQNNYTVDPATIGPSDRSAWCTGQENTCGRLCDGEVKENFCEASDLTYTCLCAANSSEPGLKYYTITMPTYLCQQEFNICNAREVSKAGKDKCEATRRANCGTLDPLDYEPKAAEETSSSTSSSASSTPTSSGVAAATTTSTSAGFAAPTMAANIGTGVFAAGVAAAFGLML